MITLGAVKKNPLRDVDFNANFVQRAENENAEETSSELGLGEYNKILNNIFYFTFSYK